MDTVEISLCLVCTVKREAGNRWVTGCPALDLYSQGKTKEDAKRCLEEAIEIWVEDCLERGTLDSALREVGMHKIHPSSLKPGEQHIAVRSIQEQEEPTEDSFNLHLSIPAYQASALLSAHA